MLSPLLSWTRLVVKRVVEAEQDEEDADDPEENSDDELGQKTVRIIRLGEKQYLPYLSLIQVVNKIL